MDIQKKETVNLRNNLSKETAEPVQTAAPKVQNPEKPLRRNQPKNRSKFLFVILVVVLLGAASAAYYFYRQASDLKKNSSQAGGDAAQQVKDVIAEVSRLMILPQDEQPTVATVSDPDKLKGQLFFANAKVGDKVLIYTKAQKAILYDPVADKIVEVAPINIGTNASSSSTPAQ